MAIQFAQTMRNLFIGRGILAALSSPCSISVYSGTSQGQSSIIAANWPSWASSNSNFLGHFTGAVWTQPNSGILLQLNSVPGQAALHSGTAGFAIIWSTEVTLTDVAGSTLPNASFIVVPCSNSVGNGVIRFDDTTFTAGVTKVILDGSIGATF